MKRLLLVAVTASLVSGCAATRTSPPAQEPTAAVDCFRDKEALSRMSGTSVAVLPFASARASIGWEFAEEFSLFLGRVGRFQMVERLQVEKLFDEQDFDPNRIEDKAAIRIGKMLGAAGVIVGTVGDDYVNVRLVNTETGVHAWNARYSCSVEVPEPSAMDRRKAAVWLIETLSDAQIGVYITAPYYLSERQMRSFGIDRFSGVAITDFGPESKAETAGLRIGDLIVKIDNTSINDYEDVTRALLGKNPGDRIGITALRGGQRLTVDVELVSRR